MKTYHIYYSYKELPETWNNIVKHDVFLQYNYLKALEDASPNNIQLYYIGVFDKNDLIGMAIIQRVQLYLKDMFRKTKVSCFKEFFQNIVSKIVKGNILVVGNLTHTGQHGIHFLPDKISSFQYFEMVFSALEDLKKQIKEKQNKKIRAFMFKDYFEEDTIHLESPFFEKHAFSQVHVQPNMMMSINPKWVSNNDYVDSFNKRYKDRYKRARKKQNGISYFELGQEDIKMKSHQLYKLYLNVSNHAKFNTFILPEDHFYSLKLQLNNHFKVFGYFLNNELIGFFTLILNGTYLETYFLGYDNVHQHPNQLYLNMLYDMVKFGIENQFENVVFARTAMEIKSSVGAIPKPLVVYVKHTNGFLNAILKQLFRLMDPTEKWEQRHPFKA